MSASAPRELRLGVAVAGDSLQVAAVDPSGRLVAARREARGDGLVEDLDRALDLVPASRVGSVTIASDELLRVLEHGGALARVAVVRIGGPVASGVSVLGGMHPDLAARLSPRIALVDGVVDAAGRRLVPLDETAAEAFLASCRGAVDAVAVAGVFAPVSPEDELRVAEIAARVLGDGTPITVSHTVSGFGLLDRENTAAVNAALIPIAAELLRRIEEALDRHGLSAEVYLAQNDGTLAGVDAAAAMPIHLLDGSFAAGIRGAGLLAGAADALVQNGGERAAHAGVLREGSVVMSATPTRIARTRMNVELPVGFSQQAPVSPHPEPSAPVISIDPAAEAPVPHSEVAAAFGCALAPVGAALWGAVEDSPRSAQQLRAASQRAIDLAVAAGADPATIAVTGLDERDLTHTAGARRRVRVQAEGRPLLIARADRADAVGAPPPASR